MHDSHDLDLIADYADGSRDPAAEELLASCADCRAEFEMHREIRSMLAGAPLPSMTEEERVSMRAGVHTQLDAGATVVSLDARRQRRWLQLGSVAAVMFVTVGVAGVLTQLGGDDTATIALEESARQSDGADGGAAADVTTAADFATEMASPESASETTTAGVTGTTAAAAEDVGVMAATEIGQAVTFPDPITRDRLDAHLAATIEWLRSRQPAEQLDAAWFNDREVPTPTCFSSEVDAVFALINATVDGRNVEVFIALDPATGDYRSDIYEIDGCTPLD